ncbi:MAG: hypothetical protein OXG16_04265 [Rhodospirillales bacterium]|nr:hypothetical protein [Rhodospirillales bacterium]
MSFTIAPDTWLMDGSATVASLGLGQPAKMSGFSAAGAAAGAVAFLAQDSSRAVAVPVEFADAEVPGLSLGVIFLDVAVQGLDLRAAGSSGTAGALASEPMDLSAKRAAQ